MRFNSFVFAILCPFVFGWSAAAQTLEPSPLGPSDAVRLLPAPPVVKRTPPKTQAGKPVQWKSPKDDAVLFRPATVTLDWNSVLPKDTRFSVSLSEDGKTFPVLIGDDIAETRLRWDLPDLPRTTLYLRVRAKSTSGILLGQHTVTIHPIPRDAIIVSKHNQRLWAFRDGVLKNRYLVSTGQIDHDTRAGWFTVYNRARKHRSSIYDVEMPFALFFSGGQAIHASTALRQLGSPASHGCVRLPRHHAQTLFEDSAIGRPVIITEWKYDTSWLDGKPASKASKTVSATTNRKP